MNFWLVALDGGLGPFQFFGRGDAFLLQGRDAAGINRLGHQRDGNAEVLRRDHRPFAGAFLAGGVEDLVHQRPTVGVLEGEDVAGDFDEVGIQFALVPFGEDLVHLVGASCPGRFSSGCRLRRSAACRRTRCRCGPS